MQSKTDTKATLALAATLLLACTFARAQAVVQTSAGKLEGISERGTVSFKGIPYATPPIGDLRWKPPLPPKPWSGVRKADAFSPGCIQRQDFERLPWSIEFMLQGPISEDCLYLNLWAPADFKDRKLPVYVFFHGGGFMEGAGSVDVYNGTNLALKGLIVVTVNYRLTALGYLAHPALSAESPQHASGNYGFLDAVASLQWIKENIAAFGGDPGKVTIGGQSAGSGMVHDLCVSPLAKGLFRGAVAESGTSLITIPMKTLAEAEKDGIDFAASRKASSLEDLRKLPAEDLLPPKGSPRVLRFAPIADGWAIPDPPLKVREEGKANDVALLTGMQADEGSGYSKTYGKMPLDEWHKQVQEKYGDLAAKFNELYSSPDDAAASIAQKASNRERGQAAMYLWCARVFTKQKGKIYTYFFNRAVPWPEHPEFGAFHTGEMVYIFSNLDKLPRPFTEVDKSVAAITSGYLVNFVRTGGPNGQDLPKWESFRADHPATLEISDSTSMRPLMDSAKLEFWKTYFDSPQGKNAPLF
jgi:para-nitrobenzyl esterase